MTRDKGVVVVTASGPLDAASSGVLKAILVDLIEGHGELRIVVDIHDMAGTDPSSLGILVEMAALAAQHGGQLTLAHPPDAPLAGVETIDAARAESVPGERRLRLLRPLPPHPADSDPRLRHPAWTDERPNHLRSIPTTTAGADQ